MKDGGFVGEVLGSCLKYEEVECSCGMDEGGRFEGV